MAVIISQSKGGVFKLFVVSHNQSKPKDIVLTIVYQRKATYVDKCVSLIPAASKL